ncbi:hypothetical protein SUDANB145_07199 (plasmid) [Streptomyces sp. enrichment culture]
MASAVRAFTVTDFASGVRLIAAITESRPVMASSVRISSVVDFLSGI